MENNLNNKIVIVTGGIQGIGYAIADKYLEKGVRTVILLDINDKQGPEAVKTLNSKYGEGKAEFFKCDITSDLDTISSKIINKYSNVDILINNAGSCNEFNVRKTFDLNVTALMEWSVKFFEHMRKDKSGKGGTIINIASIYGFRIDHFLPFYQASKYAVMGFTKSFGHAYRYQRYGVRVVAICPGYTKTYLTSGMKINDDPMIQRGFEEFLKDTEWQGVDDVANAAVEVFEKADSGTAWLIEGAKPIVSV